jgi:hypothetical protein
MTFFDSTSSSAVLILSSSASTRPPPSQLNSFKAAAISMSSVDVSKLSKNDFGAGGGEGARGLGGSEKVFERGEG